MLFWLCKPIATYSNYSRFHLYFHHKPYEKSTAFIMTVDSFVIAFFLMILCNLYLDIVFPPVQLVYLFSFHALQLLFSWLQPFTVKLINIISNVMYNLLLFIVVPMHPVPVLKNCLMSHTGALTFSIAIRNVQKTASRISNYICDILNVYGKLLNNSHCGPPW